MWKPIFGLNSPGFAIFDSRIVNHCIEVAEPIKLLRNAAGARNGGEIADNHRLHLRRGFSGALCPVLVPRVQDHAMPLFEEQLAGHQSKLSGRSRNEHPRTSAHSDRIEARGAAVSRDQRCSKPTSMSKQCR
jgi:hypothetical protein